MKKIITLLLLLFCIAFSCERDDLCPEDTPTTPKMYVEFRNNLIPENPRNVSSLRVEDVNDAERVLEDFNGVNKNHMILPLKTDAVETQFRVYKDSNILANGTNSGNNDIIKITYSTEEIYVSRACGYKTIFKNVSITIENDANNWMLIATPENNNQTVINEDDIHYTIRY